MPGVLQRVKQLLLRCATSCVEARGGDFERSLHYSEGQNFERSLHYSEGQNFERSLHYSEGQNFETVLHILKTSLLYCLWY